MNLRDGFNSSKEMYRVNGLNNLGYFDILKEVNDMKLFKMKISGCFHNHTVRSSKAIEVDITANGILILILDNCNSNIHRIECIESFNRTIRIYLPEDGIEITIEK